MTVAELIKALSAFDPNDEVEVTHVGVIVSISEAYRIPDGRIVIDADGSYYKEDILNRHLI